MKQVKRYKVVLGQNLRELEEEVEKAIWKGYVPQGGLFAHTFDNRAGSEPIEALAQAMYMSEEEYDYRMESVERFSDIAPGETMAKGK